ncbi:MAG: hypothetical protein JW843_00545 [Candidatus Aminicenantes bacterium]|nr:hypothetical protein [Candidatus Aminicenantes bacterium]
MRDERFFRTIADRFISFRGAPFSLSPADISLISAWEEADVPLETVLEGIEDSFALHPGRAHAPGKVRTLAFCRPAVERAFQRRKERAVGGKRPSAETSAGRKKRAALAAVEEFLTRRPAEVSDVLVYFEAAREILAAEGPDDEALERLDEKIEAGLLEAAEPGGSPAARLKKTRGLHRVPYVSLFYY